MIFMQTQLRVEEFCQQLFFFSFSQFAHFTAEDEDEEAEIKLLFPDLHNENILVWKLLETSGTYEGGRGREIIFISNFDEI